MSFYLGVLPTLGGASRCFFNARLLGFSGLAELLTSLFKKQID